MVLLYEEAGGKASYMIDLLHRLRAAGHNAVFADKTMRGLGMDMKRIARYVEGTQADAWIVMAGSRDVLKWFSPIPDRIIRLPKPEPPPAKPPPTQILLIPAPPNNRTSTGSTVPGIPPNPTLKASTSVPVGSPKKSPLATAGLWLSTTPEGLKRSVAAFAKDAAQDLGEARGRRGW